MEYFYGTQSAGDNGAGRIVKVIDESGTIQYAYGKLGEEVKTTRDMKFLVPGHTPWKFMAGFADDKSKRSEYLQNFTYRIRSYGRW